MKFDFSNDRPIYLQLVEQLEREIITGGFSPGDKLPSVRDLAAIAKVNPNTIQRALQELEDKKLIITIRTNGKFVTDDIKYLHKLREKIVHAKIVHFFTEMNTLGFSRAEILRILKHLK